MIIFAVQSILAEAFEPYRVDLRARSYWIAPAPVADEDVLASVRSPICSM
jgi:hypothetical protein